MRSPGRGNESLVEVLRQTKLQLPRNIPTEGLANDSELFRIGKLKYGYDWHVAAPYAFPAEIVSIKNTRPFATNVVRMASLCSRKRR